MAGDLDFQQVISKVYDDVNNALRTTAPIIVAGGTQEVLIDHTDDSIRLGDGSAFFTSTVKAGKRGLDVAIIDGALSGDFTQSGLSKELKASVFTVTDTPQIIPATAIADRNTVSIRVWGSATVYFGSTTMTSSNGYPKKQFEEMVLAVTNNPLVAIYAVCATGQTSEVRVLELA